MVRSCFGVEQPGNGFAHEVAVVGDHYAHRHAEGG